MNRIYLVRHDAAKNMHRFYQMFVAQGLLGEWSLIREWVTVRIRAKMGNSGHTHSILSSFLTSSSRTS
jgi:predicted DNA-binding WGR domain protein